DGVTELKKLREKLKKCVAEKQDYLDGWQRSRADFANLKKEGEARASGLKDTVAGEFAEKLLPLIDSFEAALGDPKWKNTDPSWRKGMESIHKELFKVMQETGVEVFEPLGDLFNPALHIAIGRGDGEEGEHVVRVERKGYRLKDKVIRPAYVTLGSQK
ncbi:MAG TPA: nucleotide exchange factor GrpE, partial [Candidatus Paceibacterota bacterium]